MICDKCNSEKVSCKEYAIYTASKNLNSVTPTGSSTIYNYKITNQERHIYLFCDICCLKWYLKRWIIFISFLVSTGFSAYFFYLWATFNTVPFGLNKTESAEVTLLLALSAFVVSGGVLFGTIASLKYIFTPKSKWGSELAWWKLPSGLYDLISIKRFY